MLHYDKPVISFFESIKNLRYRQVALILQTGFNSNLLLNAHNQNGLQFMVNYFADTDARIRLQIPINKAAYLNIAKLLLDSGLDANTIDLLTGETVLFDAIRYDDRDMVLLLLGYVDMSIRNKEGETALMFASRIGTRQVMKIMLEHLRLLNMDGYFLRQRNRYGHTALELARASNLECAKVLTKHLIHYGNQSLATSYHQHHPVLSRSASHHQLLAAAAAGLPVVHTSSRYHHHRAPSHHVPLLGGIGDTSTDDSDLDGATSAANAALLYDHPSSLRRSSKHHALRGQDRYGLYNSTINNNRSSYNQGGQLAAATATPTRHRRLKSSENLIGSGSGQQTMAAMDSEEEEQVAEAVAEDAAVQAAVEAQQMNCQASGTSRGKTGTRVPERMQQQQSEQEMGYMMDQFRRMRTNN